MGINDLHTTPLTRNFRKAKDTAPNSTKGVCSLKVEDCGVVEENSIELS